MYQPKFITSSQNVGGPSGGVVRSVVVSGGASNGSVTLYQNGQGGQVLFAMAVLANDTRVATGLHIVYSGQLYASIGPAGTSATIVY